MTWFLAIALGLSALARPQAAQSGQGLAAVKRIYVGDFGHDAESKQAQAMLIAALVRGGRFIVTVDKDRADAVITGTAIEKTSHELHAMGEGTSVGTAAGAAAVDGDAGSAVIAAQHLGASDSSVDTETDQHAAVSVSLVARNGDVLWSDTEESTGGKYEGATASAVDACAKKLLGDARGPKN
ncbi:MAG TPA: hypothetical protein VNF74_01975 [Terriglobales bacterium]|nr:hypothetical protein [Terriglobales bacterium]